MNTIEKLETEITNKHNKKIAQIIVDRETEILDLYEKNQVNQDIINLQKGTLDIVKAKLSKFN